MLKEISEQARDDRTRPAKLWVGLVALSWPSLCSWQQTGCRGELAEQTHRGQEGSRAAPRCDFPQNISRSRGEELAEAKGLEGKWL